MIRSISKKSLIQYIDKNYLDYSYFISTNTIFHYRGFQFTIIENIFYLRDEDVSENNIEDDNKQIDVYQGVKICLTEDMFKSSSFFRNHFKVSFGEADNFLKRFYNKQIPFQKVEHCGISKEGYFCNLLFEPQKENPEPLKHSELIMLVHSWIDTFIIEYFHNLEEKFRNDNLIITNGEN